MRQITCPVCSVPPSSIPPAHSRVSCNSCLLVWTYLPDEVNVEVLYRDEVYEVIDNRQSVFERIIFYEAKKILKKAEKLNPKAKYLIDFGSGKGQFLAVAKSLNWIGKGLETEKARADFAREKYGVDVACQYYEKGSLSERKADLITLNHVLEHLPQPMPLLDELLKSNLSSQGILYIEVPRADSWQAAIAGDQWMHWDIPKHLSHWTEFTLLNQMKSLGFTAISKRGFSVHLGVLGMLQALLSQLGFTENLILRLKRKKTVGLILLIGMLLPFAVFLEAVSLGFGKSGIMGLYFRKVDQVL